MLSYRFLYWLGVNIAVPPSGLPPLKWQAGFREKGSGRFAGCFRQWTAAKSPQGLFPAETRQRCLPPEYCFLGFSHGGQYTRAHSKSNPCINNRSPGEPRDNGGVLALTLGMMGHPPPDETVHLIVVSARTKAERDYIVVEHVVYRRPRLLGWDNSARCLGLAPAAWTQHG